MTTAISAVDVPPNSEISRRMTGAYYHDTFEAAIKPTSRSALELYLLVVAGTPAWINAMMALRNRVVSLFGLKNLGGLGDVDTAKPAADYRVGDRVGIFTIRYLSEQEVILGDSDKHLRAEISVCRAQDKVAVTTVVHLHNLLGRVYMLFVAPMHRLIVPASLRNAHLL